MKPAEDKMRNWDFITDPTERAAAYQQEKVEWITNDNGELGVLVDSVAYFLYKGESLIYKKASHDNGTPMHYRRVFKREFGECAHPINYKNPELIGTVSLDDSDEWKLLPRFERARMTRSAASSLLTCLIGAAIIVGVILI